MTTGTKFTKAEYATFWGIDESLVTWCSLCECWDHLDQDGWIQCYCV